MISDQAQRERIKNMRERTSRLEREGDYWTKEEIGTLVHDFNNGIGITEMADQFRRSEPAVLQQIEKMDLYRRKDHPRRRRNSKRGRCLCDRCRLDSASCPHRMDCLKEREGV